MKLTRVERFMISNQLRLLEAAYPNEAGDLARQRRAIESGYEFEYDTIMQHVYEETLSEEDSLFVLDVLEMHRAFKWSFDELADKGGLTPDAVRFPGFDGNNEGKYLSYAAHYCAPGSGNYEELGDPRRFNSHRPTLGQYRLMLDEWRELSGTHASRELTAEQIHQILQAGYPGRYKQE